MAKVVIDKFGAKCYYDNDGFLHRDDGPAYIRPDGSMFWCINGAKSSTKHPSEVLRNGERCWLIDSFIHRINGPSIDTPSGSKIWCNGNGQSTWPMLK